MISKAYIEEQIKQCEAEIERIKSKDSLKDFEAFAWGYAAGQKAIYNQIKEDAQ